MRDVKDGEERKGNYVLHINTPTANIVRKFLLIVDLIIATKMYSVYKNQIKETILV